jgi:TRAP-type mannitol/chloroaromatic compound transport system permease small subunit
MQKLSDNIDAINRLIGKGAACLIIFMVLIQFLVVVLRYVFGYGSIFMQESIIYLHAIFIMLGAGYTLMNDEHVRVDIFYREASPYKKARVNFWGSLLLLMPVCASIFYYSLPYVIHSWESLEGSKETSGIPLVFALKTSILIFCVLLFLQAISIAIKSFFAMQNLENDAIK